MKRRRLQKQVPLVLTAVASGCTDDSTVGDDSAPTVTERERTTAAPDTTTDGTDSPTPAGDDSPSLFEGRECPSFDPDADRTICYHTADRSAAPILLRPTEETFEPTTNDGSVEFVNFVLHNRSWHPYTIDPAVWEIHRRQEDAWSLTDSGTGEQNSITVPPGETHTWSLSVEAHPTPWTLETTFLFADLEDGTYAFAISGRSDADAANRVEFVALFEVVRETDT